MIRALDKGISVICLKTFGKVSFDAKEGPKGHIVGKKESNNIVFDSSRINEITLYVLKYSAISLHVLKLDQPTKFLKTLS